MSPGVLSPPQGQAVPCLTASGCQLCWCPADNPGTAVPVQGAVIPAPPRLASAPGWSPPACCFPRQVPLRHRQRLRGRSWPGLQEGNGEQAGGRADGAEGGMPGGLGCAGWVAQPPGRGGVRVGVCAGGPRVHRGVLCLGYPGPWGAQAKTGCRGKDGVPLCSGCPGKHGVPREAPGSGSGC